MRIPRIYQPLDLKIDTLVKLDEKAHHYLFHVLRLQNTHPISIFDGRGHQVHATIQAINKREIIVQIGDFVPPIPESPLKIELGQAISRSQKMDIVIQKAVELGVTSISPLITQRCAVNLSDKRMENRFEHWQGIMISACEQSGRSHLPTLNPPQPFSSWIKQTSPHLALMLDPLSENTLGNLPQTHSQQVSLLVGPEGGLSPDEILQAKQYNYMGLRLGPRILRTETAALVIITALQIRWGDML